MNRQSVPIQQIESTSPDGAENTNLHGGWLVLARAAWVVVLILSVGLFIISTPLNFAYSHIICTTASCGNNGGLTLDKVHELRHLGLSVDFYAIFNIVLSLVFEVCCVATGVVIFWHKSDERMALLASFGLVTFEIAYRDANPIPTLPPLLYGLTVFIAIFGNVTLGTFFYLFPTGRFIPRWTRWLAVVWTAYWILNSIPLPSSITNAWPYNYVYFVFLGLLASLAIIQVYRYRRVSTLAQRQQTKWVVFGISLGLMGFIVLAVFYLITHFDRNIIGDMVYTGFANLLVFLIPLSIGIAILRSGLFDIDVLINRTLVYGLLTGILALTYFGLILGLQALFTRITGQSSQSPLIIVGSTLVIAALFQPLRRRIQNMIDRRFYRRKYDARRTVANFSATLRGEVDLAQLSEQLVAIVEETMQPEHVSLWLNRHEIYKESQVHKR